MKKNTSIQLTENDIRQLAGSDVFFRGRDYFLERRVSGMQLSKGVVSADVQGSGRFPYHVDIHIKAPNNVHCQCSCSFTDGKLCKHGVALLMDRLRNPEALSVAKASKPAKKKHRESLLLKKDHAHEPPIIRVMLPTQTHFDNASTTFEIVAVVVYKGKATDVKNVAQLIDRFDYSQVRDADLPELEEFSPAQIRVLRLILTLTDKYSMDNCIKPHELSLLFLASQAEGIEVYEGKTRALTIRRDFTITPMIEIIGVNAEQFQTRLVFAHPDDARQVLQGSVLMGDPCWLIDFEQGLIVAFDAKIHERVLLQILNLKEVKLFPNDQILKFKQSVLDNVQGFVRVEDKNNILSAVKIEEVPLKVRVYLDGDSNKITADVHFIYADADFKLKDMILADAYLPQEKKRSWIKRDLSQERGLIDALMTQGGFVLDKEDNLALSGTDAIVAFVFNRLPTIASRHEVLLTQEFQGLFQAKAILRPQIHFGASGLDWFYFDISYSAEGVAAEFSNMEIQRQLVQGKNYIRLKNGKIIQIDQAAFKNMQDLTDGFDGKAKKLSLFHAPYLVEEAHRQGVSMVFEGKFKELYEQLKNFHSIEEVQVPLHFKGTLRDYQGKGLDWLEFLRYFHFGGILADEMGLGKTVQVLALLARQLESGEKLPSLVVCPTTLVWNWQEEIKKFYPDLKVLIPQGEHRRDQIRDIQDHHVILTSYALLRRDAPYYAQIQFNYVILDEAQNIKNRHTLNARMSKELNSRHRLVLTGTPMENSVADLWSIFDFLMPGFLGGYERFKLMHETPILKENSQEAMQSLGRKIRPFLMRRLKREVIKELPEKMEQVSYCMLEPTQLKTYEQMLAIARRDVADAYAKQGFNKSRMKILTVILRLRQICCHPELAHVQLGHRLMVSAKLNLLKEIVEEAISGGHKILIFSQFVHMLEIIAEYLKKEKIVFELMDGSTKDRAGCVERFNNTETVKVFLLSLKVGGVGLNLTSADTVILYEPWWNPAVEDQAIDRAHRIGQKNTVTAYKLICKGTIEEKILELQKRKKNIIDSLVVSEEGIAKSIGWEDIKFLLDI